MEKTTHLIEAAKQVHYFPFILNCVIGAMVIGTGNGSLEDDTCIMGDNIPSTFLENRGR